MSLYMLQILCAYDILRLLLLSGQLKSCGKQNIFSWKSHVISEGNLSWEQSNDIRE